MKIAEFITLACSKVKQKNQLGFGISSPQAKELDAAIKGLEDAIVQTGVIPPEWDHKSSIGKGNLASVMWVVFLPPGQTTQDGIYVSCCLGKSGNGLVAGCTISNTSKAKYHYVPTVERRNPVVDVDGTRPGTHYNNGYVNPQEFLVDGFDEDVFLNHLKKSVAKCKECLNMHPTTHMTPSFNLKSHEKLQVITYGAPGTGKSWSIEQVAKTCPERVIRTTFHPDCDYSTFVGAYKPTMEFEVEEKVNEYLTVDQLAQRLKSEYNAAGEGSDKGKALAVDLFAEEYYEYLDGAFGKVSLAELVSKAGMTKGYMVGLRDSINVAKFHALQRKGKRRIGYKFVAQAFAKAYVKAWQLLAAAIQAGAESAEPVYLVIEEINRGNCAQVFGDIFQLLDRKNGYSQYPIKADEDLRQHLADAFEGLNFGPQFAKVQTGEELVLPNNLCIWATMNTSDQSLFPMDSAFKRRWDWKYVPIKNANLGWKIKFVDCEIDWWKFLVKINKVVKSVTNSADKQLGYFFVKLNEGETEISADMFVNKVAFYLWNDVFKDCELDGDAFKITREDGDGVLAFEDFFKDDGTINEAVLKNFLEMLVPAEVPVQE